MNTCNHTARRALCDECLEKLVGDLRALLERCHLMLLHGGFDERERVTTLMAIEEAIGRKKR